MTQLHCAPTPIAWDDAGDLETLTFDLRGETFAVEAVLVREIIDVVAGAAVPGAPALAGGVVNFRGRIIPLVDLGLAFGMAAVAAAADAAPDAVADAGTDGRIVVIELALAGEPVLLGLRTDRVHEVATLRRADSEDPPMVGMRWRRDYVRGLIRREADVVVLPDLHAIFAPLVGPEAAVAGADRATSH